MSEKLILIAEDELDAATLLVFHFQRNGFRTLTATDGSSALKKTFACKPDLVILDLMLPKLHGREVCRVVKSSPNTRHIPILMLTALARGEDKIQGFKVGADDYVTKPYDVRELIIRANALLNRAQPRTENVSVISH